MEHTRSKIIKEYSQTMGGADQTDQNVAAYRTTMSTNKWSWPLYAYTIGLQYRLRVSELYRKTPSYNENPMDILALRRDVIRVSYKTQQLSSA